jgi:endogenous inhibitor of DNA gyrase (YacG/DUF329 family)
MVSANSNPRKFLLLGNPHEIFLWQVVVDRGTTSMKTIPCPCGGVAVWRNITAFNLGLIHFWECPRCHQKSTFGGKNDHQYFLKNFYESISPPCVIILSEKPK